MTDRRTGLPGSWITCTFGDVFAKLQYGHTASADWNASNVRFLRITDLSDQDVTWSDVPFCEPTDDELRKFSLSIGDFVFARSGSIEKAWQVSSLPKHQQAVFASYLIRGVPLDLEIGGWLRHFIRSGSYLTQIGAAGAGIGMQNVNAQKLSAVELPLPPLDEQRRIVAKLDALFEKSRVIRDKLDRVPRLLANLQKSILNAAFRGELTREWRANNPSAEPASELLKRIRTERRAKWEADLIAKGKDPKKAKYAEAEPVNTDGLPELPEDWCWATADEIAWEVTVGHVGPMKSMYVDSGVLFLRSKNVRANRIDHNDLISISGEAHASLSKSRLSPGDLVVVRTGAPGTAAVIPKDMAMANCSDLVITRLLPAISPDFVAYFMNSPVGAARVLSRQVGVAQQHFNVGEMKQTPIPIPPVIEQAEIVRLLEANLNRCDSMRRIADSAISRSENWTNAILRSACRGELVPQDPTDEPASVLLERIRAQRVASTAKRSRSRKAVGID